MFYVYELCEPDGKPFYVGKGKAGRWNHHERLARRGFQYRVHNKIRKLWAEGKEIVKRVVFETLDEDIALAKEKELIAQYGLENLTNMTTGGDSVRFTSDIKEKISKALKGKPKSAEAKRKCSESKKGSIPWNKGKGEYLLPEVRARVISGHIASCKGKPSWNSGLKYPALMQRGKIPPNKGKQSPLRGVPKSAATRRNMVRGAYLRWLMQSVQQTGYCGA